MIPEPTVVEHLRDTLGGILAPATAGRFTLLGIVLNPTDLETEVTRFYQAKGFTFEKLAKRDNSYSFTFENNTRPGNLATVRVEQEGQDMHIYIGYGFVSKNPQETQRATLPN